MTGAGRFYQFNLIIIEIGTSIFSFKIVNVFITISTIFLYFCNFSRISMILSYIFGFILGIYSNNISYFKFHNYITYLKIEVNGWLLLILIGSANSISCLSK